MQAIVDGILGLPIQPVQKTWNKVKDGQKVKGDHKKTDGTTRKPETISEIGGKINMGLKNFNSKESRYGPGGWKKELIRYLKELHEKGGVPSPLQWRKAMLLGDDEVTNVLQLFADGPQIASPEHDNDNDYGGAEEQTEPITESMVRPDGTPRRPSPDSQVEQPPAKRPALAPRVLNTPAATSDPVVAGTPAPVASTSGMAAANDVGPSGGSDPAGGGATWECQSHPPSFENTPDGLKITFGGSRLMYTWALDMRMHGITYFSDFQPVGHSIPWDWIPFYCTPAEWSALPWSTHDLSIKRVGVSVTPVGKEVQFATASGQSTIASNEHLAVGFKAVGLNHRDDIPGYGLRRVKNNVVGTTMITNTSDYIDYIDLRKRYWGPLSDFTLTTIPDRYGTTAQLSTAELSMRENEVIGGIYVDKYDATDQEKNKASFGPVMLDRYVTRFPLMPQLGKPIIQEVYEPHCGMLNHQPHRVLLQASRSMRVGGPSNTCTDLYNTTIDGNISNKVSPFTSKTTDLSRNVNIGSEVMTNLGSYHGQIEKYTVLEKGGFQANPPLGKGQKSINFGISPIRLINIAASAPEYVQARCVWKIDYFMEITAKFQVPSHPYATNVSANGSVYPPNMYISAIPRHYFNVPTWDSTTATKPARENYVQGHMFNRQGHVFQSPPDTNVTLSALMGANAVAKWKTTTVGLDI